VKRFEHLAPKSVAEALEMLYDQPEAIPLAKGTDLLMQVKEGSRWVETLLNLKRVPELRQYVHNGALTVGSTVGVGRVAVDPQIQQAYGALAMGADLAGPFRESRCPYEFSPPTARNLSMASSRVWACSGCNPSSMTSRVTDPTCSKPGKPETVASNWATASGT
jgi:hypothetical protein